MSISCTYDSKINGADDDGVGDAQIRLWPLKEASTPATSTAEQALILLHSLAADESRNL